MMDVHVCFKNLYIYVEEAREKCTSMRSYVTSFKKGLSTYNNLTNVVHLSLITRLHYFIIIRKRVRRNFKQ